MWSLSSNLFVKFSAINIVGVIMAVFLPNTALLHDNKNIWRFSSGHSEQQLFEQWKNRQRNVLKHDEPSSLYISSFEITSLEASALGISALEISLFSPMQMVWRDNDIKKQKI